MIQRPTFGWQLVIGGLFKITYDPLLLVPFRGMRPADERVVQKSLPKHRLRDLGHIIFVTPGLSLKGRRRRSLT